VRQYYDPMQIVPLQTLWVNFTTQIFQAVGLGYGEPSPDLMARKPRPPDEPILPRSLHGRWG
jgi:Ca2+-transporting ATPase